jgi:hypothetical protein
MALRRMKLTALAAVLAAQSLAALSGCGIAGDPYDEVVLADRPVAYWTMAHAQGGTEPDRSGSAHDGYYFGSPANGLLPNGSGAATFDGTQYLQVPDAADLRPATRGVLTIEGWIRPDTIAFSHEESTGYVHWMGKADGGQYEYVARMYSAGNAEDRANRISGYYFNLPGGLGAGSYFQDPVTPGEWIHFVLVINRHATTDEYPHGYTKVYKNGVLRDQDDLSIGGRAISSGPGHAPLRLGTSDFESFFEGAIGKVAIYNGELTPDQVMRHYQVMTGHGAATASVAG